MAVAVAAAVAAAPQGRREVAEKKIEKKSVLLDVSDIWRISGRFQAFSDVFGCFQVLSDVFS